MNRRNDGNGNAIQRPHTAFGVPLSEKAALDKRSMPKEFNSFFGVTISKGMPALGKTAPADRVL